MTLHGLLTEGTQKLDRAGVLEAKLDARRLLLEAFQTDMAHFLMNQMQQLPGDQATEQAVADYRAMIDRRCKRIPIQYILGHQEFMGLTFRVNGHVLIPRQDTETLVEQVLAEQMGKRQDWQEKRILDLCTGSGCIAISLMAKGGFFNVTAADLSENALQAAKENAEDLLEDTEIVAENWGEEVVGRGTLGEKENAGRSHRKLRLCKGDLFQALEPGDKFDILVSNPPYIPTSVIGELQPEVRDYEPVLALDGCSDGKEFYRRIAGEAKNWLNPGAAVYLEIGYDQGEGVCQLFRQNDFKNIRVVKDLPGLDRVIRADYVR